MIIEKNIIKIKEPRRGDKIALIIPFKEIFFVMLDLKFS